MSTQKSKILKTALFCGAACGAMFQTNTALAQEDDGSGDRIVVTGTRITSGNLTSPVPVSSVDAEYIKFSGETILTDVLSENPALISSTRADGIGDDGVAALNLRNLGDARTLVLVNGRRHIASRAGTSVVDVNTIPSALVERVDVLTGGASAIYGADGVSGVVNFIMKDDFEGAELNINANLPDEAGGKNYLASATIGTNFDGGRGNVALNFEYFRQNRLLNTQRGLTPGLPETIELNPDDDFSGGDSVDNPNLPDRILVGGSTLPLTSIEGVVFTGPFDFSFIPQFTGDGRVFDTGLLLSSGRAIGGDGLPQGNAVPMSIDNPQDRYTVNLLSRYEVSDNVEVYGEFKYVNTDQRTDLQAYAITDSLAFSYENPFIPDSIVLDPVSVFTFEEDMMGDPIFTDPVPVVLMGRDDFDLSRKPRIDKRELYRFAGGQYYNSRRTGT